MSTESHTLGQRIKHFRQAKSLSQPELAEKMGIEQSYLSKLENDKSVPSKDMFQALLDGLAITLGEFIGDTPSHSLDARMLQIPQVRDWSVSVRQSQTQRMRRYLYLCVCLMVTGGTLFYTGLAEKLFPTTAYEYRSDGIVLPGEPENVFQIWVRLVNGRDERDAKQSEMLHREDMAYKTFFTPQGASFREPAANGFRYYTLSREYSAQRHENGWLQTTGLLLFLAGLAGLLLERRLARWQTDPAL